MFISSNLIIFDNPLCTEFSRYGLIVVSLSDDLAVNYLYFHHTISFKLNVSISKCRAGFLLVMDCKAFSASCNSFLTSITVFLREYV